MGGHRAAGDGGAEGREEREREKRERGGGGGVGRPREGGRRAGWGGWGAGWGPVVGGCWRWVAAGEEKREKGDSPAAGQPAGVGADGGRPEVGRRRPSPAAGRLPATEKNLGGKDNVRWGNSTLAGLRSGPSPASGEERLVVWSGGEGGV
ncbi:hypothetical protein TIFTF001_021186 [Ficus carica]|uniref:Uncharacterized protein n=1 Tax=Ficus carica TaxID=3494 RepID=A0AA88AFB3_FICCA|nr:hypothetical protein TIFTF001_021186 [Ficus carica]